MIKTDLVTQTLKFKGTPTIALVYRSETSNAIALAEKLTFWLKDRGHKVFTAPEQKAIKGAPLISVADLKKVSLIVVLGGDGSYLRAARLLEKEPVPILGVNLGSLGFLTPVRADELFTAMEDTLKGKMQLAPRAMIEVEFKSGGKKQHAVALNDVVIERGRMSQLIVLSMKLGKEFISEVKADGLIVSTPTGSSAYNLAAGGPLLHPSVHGLTVTPIAPHSLTSRPFIVPDDEDLIFRVNIPNLPAKIQKADPTAQLIIDGQFVTELASESEVRIRRHEKNHWMVQDPKKNFFYLLRDKLKFGDRA